MPPLSAILHDPRFQRRWRFALALLAAVTAWFAFMPGERVPQVSGVDKIDHLMAFGALACSGALSLRAGWRQTIAAALGLVLYGGFIEVVQSFLPTRHGDWADLVADSAGIALGLVAVALARRAFAGAAARR